MLGAATGRSLGLAGGVCCCAAAEWCSREIVNVAFCVWCCGDNKGLMVAFWFALLLGSNKIDAMDNFWWWRLSARYRHKATRICYSILLPSLWWMYDKKSFGGGVFRWRCCRIGQIRVDEEGLQLLVVHGVIPCTRKYSRRPRAPQVVVS